MTQKEIPLFINDFWVRVNDKYINRFGVKRYANSTRHGEIEPCLNPETQKTFDKNRLFYTDIEENGDLSINRIMVKTHIYSTNDELIDENKISFYAVEYGRISYNKKYNELCVNGIHKDEFFYEYANSLNKVPNATIMASSFIQRILTHQDWCEKAFTERMIISVKDNDAITIICMFLHNQHKMITHLFNHIELPNVKEYLQDTFNGKVTGYFLCKKDLDVAISSGISLEIASEICAKYNPSEIMKFIKILKYFGMEIKSINEIMDRLNKIDNLDFTKFADYFIKQTFIADSFKIEKRLSFADYDSSKSPEAFVHLYQDYMAIKNDEDTCYPENLKNAHDNAINQNCTSYNGKSYSKKQFRMATAQYDYLEWNCKNYKIVIPVTPQDVINEGKIMHHCVSSYIGDIINGELQILFLRKDNDPCVTIEVVNKEIIQAKTKFNGNPDTETTIMIKKWAKEKHLDIIRF